MSSWGRHIHAGTLTLICAMCAGIGWLPWWVIFTVPVGFFAGQYTRGKKL